MTTPQFILYPADRALVIKALKKLDTPEARDMVVRIRERTRETKKMRRYRDVARTYVDEKVDVDDSAVVSVSVDGGAWVSSWTWVSDESVTLEKLARLS